MISLQELCQYLEEILQASAVSDFSVNGLQIEGTSKIKKMATAVSVNLETIETAVEQGVQALIVHHGLFWNKDSYVIKGSKREKIRLLLENEISLLAYHLPLDAHQEYGNNWGAAKEMGWKDLEPFGVYNGIPIGVKGKIKETSREKFAKDLEKYYEHCAHVAFGGKEKIKSVALISGGAYKSVLEASSEGIDCFITGNFDEPVWHQSFEEKINFYALGHSNTERVGPRRLAQHLEMHYRIPCGFIDIANPF